MITNEIRLSKIQSYHTHMKLSQISFRKLGTDVVNEEHRAIVDSIARHVVYDCASATACMTTNAVTFLLLTRFVFFL